MIKKANYERRQTMKKILIIEDEKIIRNELKSLLENSGYEVLIIEKFDNVKENIKNIIAVDLNSTDETKQILEKLSNEYENIKVANWKECKDLFDNIDDTKL